MAYTVMACIVMAYIARESSLSARRTGHKHADRHVHGRAPGMAPCTLESPYTDGHFEYRHDCARAVGIPSAMPDVECDTCCLPRNPHYRQPTPLLQAAHTTITPAACHATAKNSKWPLANDRRTTVRACRVSRPCVGTLGRHIEP